MNLKSQLAPKGIEFKPTEFMMSGKYCTILTIITYPKSIYEGYLANITNISGVKIAIKHIPRFSISIIHNYNIAGYYCSIFKR